MINDHILMMNFLRECMNALDRLHSLPHVPPLACLCAVGVRDTLDLDVVVRHVDLLTRGRGLVIPLPHHILCTQK